jgi:hypothetical protein
LDFFIFSGVSGQQQSFRKRPEDVEVKMGDTAILRCEIENQAGKAQWTKDGFVLGKSQIFTRLKLAIN